MNHSAVLSPLTWSTLVSTWQLDLLWAVVAAVLLASYVLGLRVLRTAGQRPVSFWRVGSFAAGCLLLVATPSSSIGVYAMSADWVHMVLHLMLIMVVPALLVLGHPLTVLRAVAATRGREARVDSVLRHGPFALVSHPLVSLVIYTVVIVGTHLTSFMDLMATSTTVMVGEQVLYVVAGYLYLLTLIGEEPIRWRLPTLGRIGLVLLGMTPDTIVGIVLLQADHDLSPTMSAMHPSWAPSALVDQQVAGGLMWAVGDGLMMCIGVGLTVALISRPTSTNLLGARLEGVRRQTLAAHVSRGETGPSVLSEDVDVDDDDAMLDAYNAMLGRMNEPGHR